jgi:TPR repeat protein
MKVLLYRRRALLFGICFFREENDDKAIEYYNKALKKGFDNARVLSHRIVPNVSEKYDDTLKKYKYRFGVDPFGGILL